LSFCLNASRVAARLVSVGIPLQGAAELKARSPSRRYKKLCCRREAARCFVSLNILLRHSGSFKVRPLS